ncbi:zinc-binding dehydrogenase [Kitasatospora sp. NPDC054939]
MSLPRSSREVRLVAAPDGLPAPEHFALVESPLPVPGPGQVLLRNRWFLVFPGLRTLIGGELENVPLPQLRPGDTLIGPAVGEVVSAPDGGPLRPGDLVLHLYGWREFAVVDAAGLTALGDSLPDPVAHLSQGVSAYAGLRHLARVREGDVVLVTGAAGAVGSLAGQIARLLGAGRVVGTTGSPAKAERLTAELGYDAVVLRDAGPPVGSVAAQLAKAAPDGIDVVLDTVGGEQLTAALDAARPGARFALIGALAGQLAPGRRGGSAPVEIDTFRLVTKGVSLHGFSSSGSAAVEPEWRERFGGWLREGRISFPRTLVAGIDRAPGALPELLAGRYFGTAVVEL